MEKLASLTVRHFDKIFIRHLKDFLQLGGHSP